MYNIVMMCFNNNKLYNPCYFSLSWGGAGNVKMNSVLSSYGLLILSLTIFDYHKILLHTFTNTIILMFEIITKLYKLE